MSVNCVYIMIHYEPSSRAYTGYIDFDAKHLFFYFFESRNDPDKDDVIFWTNGGEPLDSTMVFVCTVLDHIDSQVSGPGCSSSLGLLMEMGRCMQISRHSPTTTA